MISGFVIGFGAADMDLAWMELDAPRADATALDLNSCSIVDMIWKFFWKIKKICSTMITHKLKQQVI